MGALHPPSWILTLRPLPRPPPQASQKVPQPSLLWARIQVEWTPTLRGCPALTLSAPPLQGSRGSPFSARLSPRKPPGQRPGLEQVKCGGTEGLLLDGLGGGNRALSLACHPHFLSCVNCH